MKIERVKTETFTMDYFRFGSGEKTMVILPGLSVQSVMIAADVIAESYAAFAKDYTVYVFDRRADLPSHYTVRDMACDTADAMATIGLRDTYLFGASQGGMMAMVIAIEHPELVCKLALGSTTARLTDEQYLDLERWIALAKCGDREGLYLAFGEAIYPPKVFAQYRQTLIDASSGVTDADLARFLVLAEGTHGFDVLDQLERISCPVLALGASDDRIVGGEATLAIAEKLKCKKHLYSGYGHAAYDTAPDYRQRLLSFFEA